MRISQQIVIVKDLGASKKYSVPQNCSHITLPWSHGDQEKEHNLKVWPPSHMLFESDLNKKWVFVGEVEGEEQEVKYRIITVTIAFSGSGGNRNEMKKSAFHVKCTDHMEVPRMPTKHEI